MAVTAHPGEPACAEDRPHSLRPPLPIARRPPRPDQYRRRLRRRPLVVTERAPQPGGDVLPLDALVVSVDPGGDVELTEPSAVRARWPHLDRLPNGRFVGAASRARRYEDANQVQIFDALGRETLSFSVGDGAIVKMCG